MPDAQVHTIMFTGRVGAEEVGGVEINFAHFAQSFLNAVYCTTSQRTKTGLTFAFDIIERHGPFGLVKITVNDPTWAAKWANNHSPGPLSRSEAIFTQTAAQARTEAQNVRAAWKQVIDARGVPAAATEVQRVINFLRSLDLSGHHEGFEVVRQSYINVFSDQSGTGLYHWFFRAPLAKYDPTTQGFGFAVDPVVVQAMVDEMNAVDMMHPIRLMHYACSYGQYSAFFEFPITQ